MLKKEYTEFQKSIKRMREIVVQINGVVEGVSNVKKSRKAPLSKTDNVIAMPTVHEKD
ncbi:MAG: hypothetical protein IJ870_02720 [Alphaproteobacteria bacterium]|nr:hypothetical protein [Alphaproteobacteria bacterium]